jgi:predicted small lipoprotein YifL
MPVTQRSAKPVCVLIASLGVALLLSGCGRRGPLEPPPGSRQPAAQAQGGSTFAGSPTFRPGRETSTTANTSEEAPATPQVPQPGASNLPAVQTVNPGGTEARSGPRSQRQSAPPRTPFILDPLL